MRRVMMATNSTAPPAGGVTVEDMDFLRFESAGPTKIVPLPATSAGDMLCMVVAAKSIQIAAFTVPAGWSDTGRQIDGSGGGSALRVFTTVAAASGASSVTLSSASNTAAGVTVFRVVGAIAADMVGRNWSNRSTNTVIPAPPPGGPSASVSLLFAFYNLSVSQWALPDAQSNQADVAQLSPSQLIRSVGEGESGIAPMQPYVLSRTTYAAEILLVFS